MTTSTMPGKVATAVGTMLIMFVLVLISFASAVIIMTIAHKIMADTASFWSYVVMIAFIIYDIILFSNWHNMVARLNKFFWNWK